MKRAQKPTQIEQAKQTLDYLTPGHTWRITRYVNDDFYTVETNVRLGSKVSFELTVEQLDLIDSDPQEFVNLVTQRLRQLGLLPYEPPVKVIQDGVRLHGVEQPDGSWKYDFPEQPVSETRLADMEPRDAETMRRFLDGADRDQWVRAPAHVWRSMMLDGWVTMENYNKLVSDRNRHRDRAEMLGRDKAILTSKNDEFAKIRDDLVSENEGLRQDLDALGEANTYFADENERLQRDLDSCERFTTELRPIRERDTEMLQHAEAVELVTAMLAGAGFELLRDPPGETAMWMQKLDSRPIAQVFVMLTHEQLMLPPAQIYTLVKSQVGSS